MQTEGGGHECKISIWCKSVGKCSHGLTFWWQSKLIPSCLPWGVFGSEYGFDLPINTTQKVIWGFTAFRRPNWRPNIQNLVLCRVLGSPTVSHPVSSKWDRGPELWQPGLTLFNILRSPGPSESAEGLNRAQHWGCIYQRHVARGGEFGRSLLDAIWWYQCCHATGIINSRMCFVFLRILCSSNARSFRQRS